MDEILELIVPPSILIYAPELKDGDIVTLGDKEHPVREVNTGQIVPYDLKFRIKIKESN